ncbi:MULTISPECIES: response regulator [unclassified Rhizobium]|uniref:response regulator n=1 Tax=unclassified Rhizobium TaxID=2613769 RepID=UPI000DB93667|nr:response regulator [Rhizobium sp. AN80A]
MSDERHEWISKRAYGLWEENGRQWGRDQEYWLQAASERDHMEMTRASPDGREVLERRDRFTTRVELLAPNQGALELHRKVLIVDDEPILRFAAVSTLEDAGYVAMEAANASEALLWLRKHRVDAVITDINMPGEMDGLGLAAKVRQLWPETRVIVTSGLVSLRASDIGEGITFLSKPYEESALLRTLPDAA